MGMAPAFLFLAKNGIRIAEDIRSKRIVNYAVRIGGCQPTIKNISIWLKRISD